MSTANAKMQYVRTILGLSILLGLLTQNGLADISLTLSEGHGGSGGGGAQEYLPPTAQGLPIDEAINQAINEEIIKIQEESQLQPFEKSKQSNARYRILEVHNHYQPSQQQQQQHHQQAQTHAASSLNFNAPEYSAEESVNGPEHSSATSKQVPFPSNYQHGFQQSALQLGNKIEAPAFKGPDYLPPSSEGALPISNEFENYSEPQKISVPQQHAIVQELRSSTTFRGPDYLPPHSHEKALTASAFRGPDYLPPHGQSGASPGGHGGESLGAGEPGASAFRGPEYLPPHGHAGASSGGHSDDFSSDNDGLTSGFTESSTSAFHGSDYSPSHEHGGTPQTGHGGASSGGHGGASLGFVDSGATGFRGPDYLPPHENGGASLAGNGGVSSGGHSGASLGFVDSGATGFRGPDYLPPHEHGGASLAGNGGASSGGYGGSSLGFVDPGATGFRGPDYLPPHGHGGALLARHDGARSGSHGGLSTGSAEPGVSSFRGPDYLPPHHTDHQHHHHHPNQHQYQHQKQHHHHHSVSVAQGLHQTTQQGHFGQDVYRGPDYLPPHTSSSLTEVVSGIAHEQNELSQSIPSSTGFKRPEYLSPHHEISQHIIQNAAPSQASYKAPDYLPPHTEHVAALRGFLPAVFDFNSEEKQHVPAQQVQLHEEHLPFLYPPHSPLQQHIVEHNLAGAVQPLPPGYDFDKPENAEEAIAQLHSLQIEEQQRQQQQQQQQQQDVVVQSQLQVAGREEASDTVYGQPKIDIRSSIEGAGHSISQINSAASVQPETNYQIQQSQVQTAPSLNAQSSFGQQQQEQQLQQHLQQTSPQVFATAAAVEAAPAYNAPNVVPLASTATARAAATATQSSSSLHSLSSYMNSVQPFARYGHAQVTAPRRPFAEYGPPPATTTPHVPPQQLQRQPLLQQSIEVSPMYREQATRFQYYAPAISYDSNAAVGQAYATYTTAQQKQRHHSGYTLSAQARQSLQRFMPKGIQQQIAVRAPAAASATATAFAQAPAAAAAAPASTPTFATAAALQAPPPAAGKIRTVQIVNSHSVKTLKVLETSDQAGVKTIKILGPSNERPSGEHRVVKVVSPHDQGNGQHVQTVKIFNDQQEVSLTGGHSTNVNNGYLPPIAASSMASKRAVRKRRQTAQRRHAAATGSQRHHS